MLVLSFVLRVGGKTDLRQGMVTSWLSLPGCGWRCSRPSQTALKGGRGRVSLLSLGAAGGQGLYFPLWSRVFQTAGLCLPPQNEVPEAGSMLMSSLSPPGALSNATSEDPQHPIAQEPEPGCGTSWPQLASRERKWDGLGGAHYLVGPRICFLCWLWV